MATEVLELQIRTVGVNEASTQFDRLNKSVSGVRSALGFFRNVLVLASFARLTSGILDVVDAFQRMQNQLKLVTDSTADANGAFQLVYETALRTRTPLEAVNLLFGRLIRVGGLLKLTFGQVNDITRAVSESFQISGATADEAKNSIIQLTQGLNLGILRGQDLRSVTEFNPRLATVFADKLNELGLATDKYGKKIKLAGNQLYSFVTAHKNILTTQIAIAALTENVQKLDFEFAKANPTVGQLFTNLSTTFTYLSGILLRSSGLINVITDGIQFLVTHLGSIIGVVGAIGAALATWLVIEGITSLFAHFITLAKGLVGFVLSPIINIAKGFYNLGYAIYSAGVFLVDFAKGAFRIVSDIASFVARVAVGAFNFAGAILSFSAAVASGIVNVLSGAGSLFAGFASGFQSFLAAINIGFIGVRIIATAMEGLTQFIVSATEATSEFSETFIRFSLDTVDGVSSAFKNLVTVVGSVGAAFAQLASTFVAGAAQAIITALLTILSLIPLITVAILGLTAVGGGLTALAVGISGLAGGVEAAANATLSWHDIFNSFIRVVLVAFDILKNHFPLVIGALGEAWNSFVALLLNGINVVVQGINSMVSSLSNFAKLLGHILPIIGAFGGAAAGSLLGPVGAVIGGLVGGGLGFGGEAKFDAFIDGVTGKMQGFADTTAKLTADAGRNAGHKYTDELLATIKTSFAGHNGDFVKALDLLGQGASTTEIAKKTGVSIEDIQTASDIRNKIVPQHGQFADIGGAKHGPHSDLSNLAQTNAVALDNFIKQVSPYAAAVAKVDEADRLFKKIELDNARAAKRGFPTLNIKKQLEEAGIGTQAELMKRLARETDGVGNAATAYDEKLKLLNIDLKKNYITQDEATRAALEAKVAFLQTQHDFASGVALAYAQHDQKVGNPAGIATEAVSSAFSNTDALQKYQISVQAITQALTDQKVSATDAANSIRDLKIELLSTQTDALSGFQAGVLESQKNLNNFAATARDTVTTAFNDLQDTLVNFFDTGKLNFKTFTDDLLKNMTKLAVQQVFTGPLSNLLAGNVGGSGEGGDGIGGLFSGIFGGGGLGGLLGGKKGDSPTNPLYVTMAGGIGDILGGGSSGGIGSIFSKGGFFSNLFNGGGGAGSTSSGILGALSGIGSFLGFADAGQFTVGGHGGPDSQLVPLKLTPGEVVQVHHGDPNKGSGSNDNSSNGPLVGGITFIMPPGTNMDTFKRSEGQLTARVAMAVQRAAMRNG